MSKKEKELRKDSYIATIIRPSGVMRRISNQTEGGPRKSSKEKEKGLCNDCDRPCAFHELERECVFDE